MASSVREARELRLVWGAILLCASNAAAQRVVFQTSAAPEPEENIAKDCRYEITIPNPSKTIRAVWVILDRGETCFDTTGTPRFKPLRFITIWPFYFRSTAERKHMKTWMLSLPKGSDAPCLRCSLNWRSPRVTKS